MKPSSPEAFRLMMEGSAALADVEGHGMKIDEAYLDRVIDESEILIGRIEEDLRKDDVFQEWVKAFGTSSDLGSRQQLGEVVFNRLGVECKKRTKTGLPSTDEEALEDVDFPFVKRWTDLQKLKTTRSTFLIGLKKETVNGYVHPFFNLHTASTYRSSSSDPNLQNQPIRDPRQAKLIRRAFVPRSDEYVLVEIDYSALEFRGAANFWHDPDMVKYANDTSLDIHRDMAAECFDLPLPRVSKDARSFAKNQFVFPRLYGSYYKNISESLWWCIGKHNIKTADGVHIYDHLASRGIHDKRDFEYHIKKVEDRFNNRFPVWSREKDVWWKKYLERGWFPLSTGFVCHGVFAYTNLMNTPIQGPSFHCLLWSLIRLNEWLKKKLMRSRVICQIHDSIIGDVHRSELDDYINMARKIMTEDIRKVWPWIVTVLGVEVDVAETNWFAKSEWVDDGSGHWIPKKKD